MMLICFRATKSGSSENDFDFTNDSPEVNSEFMNPAITVLTNLSEQLLRITNAVVKDDQYSDEQVESYDYIS